MNIAAPAAPSAEALQALIGGVMRELRGNGDAATVSELLISKLSE